MYVYRVTNRVTNEYYFGISLEPKSSYQPTQNLDPAGKFRQQGHNGITSMKNVSKSIEMLCHSTEELIQQTSELTKNHEHNDKFLGLLASEDEKIILSDGVRELLEQDYMLLPPYDPNYVPKNRVFTIDVTDSTPEEIEEIAKKWNKTGLLDGITADEPPVPQEPKERKENEQPKKVKKQLTPEDKK